MAEPVDQVSGDELADQTKIDFSFQTFGELKQAFGPKRATSMLRAYRRKETGRAAESVSKEDIDVALRFLRGDKTGAQSSKALRAFKSYFLSSEQRRKACESYLVALRDQIPE